MSAVPLAVTEPTAPSSNAHHLRTARRVFQGSLLYTCAITVFWAVVLVLGPERAPFFGKYRIDPRRCGNVFFGFLVFSRDLGLDLVRHPRAAPAPVRGPVQGRGARGRSPPACTSPSTSRGYLGRYSERRIRITDMIGRRGRFVTIGVMGFLYIYGRVSVDPKPEYLQFGAADSLFDAMALQLAGPRLLLLGRVPRDGWSTARRRASWTGRSAARTACSSRPCGACSSSSSSRSPRGGVSRMRRVVRCRRRTPSDCSRRLSR